MHKVEKKLKGAKVIDLFAGIGGFHLAFKSYGAKTIYASEWDKYAADVYEKNYKIKPEGDITKIDEKSIPQHNILCAGFPCQPFSISGKRLGFNDTRGTLFFDVARIVKEKKPEIVFLENVKNFETHDNGKTLTVVVNTLKELGYTVFHEVLNAADFSLPQSRKRIYIVGFREDLNIKDFSFPKPKKLKKHVEDILETTSPYFEELTIDRKDIKISSEKNDYDSRPIRIGTVGNGGQGERIYDVKGTSITLSANGGGIGAKTGLYLIGGRVRRLTPRECARLQGFPETFKIPDNKNIAYKQFGNSVAIDVLQYIIEEICNSLGGSIEWQ